jgi:hypothetical protein
MQKAGMTLQGPYEFDGKEAVMYAIEQRTEGLAALI